MGRMRAMIGMIGTSLGPRRPNVRVMFWRGFGCVCDVGIDGDFVFLHCSGLEATARGESDDSDDDRPKDKRGYCCKGKANGKR